MAASRRAPSRSPSVTPEDVLAPFPGEVRALAEEMCGYFCALFPNREGVRLGFEHGASLPDPEVLLTGSGKRVRYVVLRPGAAVPRGAIRELLDAALLHGAVR